MRADCFFAAILALAAAPAFAIVPAETDTHVIVARTEGPAVVEHLTGTGGDGPVHISYLRRTVEVVVERVEGGSFTAQEMEEVRALAVVCAEGDLQRYPEHFQVTQPGSHKLVYTFACLTEN